MDNLSRQAASFHRAIVLCLCTVGIGATALSIALRAAGARPADSVMGMAGVVMGLALVLLTIGTGPRQQALGAWRIIGVVVGAALLFPLVLGFVLGFLGLR